MSIFILGRLKNHKITHHHPHFTICVRLIFNEKLSLTVEESGHYWVSSSEFLSYFSLYSRLLADFLSHLGKWVRLIKFEAEYEHFYTREVEKPQNNTFSPSFTMCISQDSLN